MQKIFLVLIVLFSFKYSYSQNNESVSIMDEDTITNNSAGLKSGEIRKNSIYTELGGTGAFWSLVNYDRIIPITNRIAFVPRIGIGFYDALYPVYELNLIFGQRHFFETGFGQYMFFNTIPEKDFMIRAGYRYHGRKGFLFRAAPQLYRVAGDIPEDDNLQFWFGMSFGYCF